MIVPRTAPNTQSLEQRVIRVYVREHVGGGNFTGAEPESHVLRGVPISPFQAYTMLQRILCRCRSGRRRGTGLPRDGIIKSSLTSLIVDAVMFLGASRGDATTSERV